MKTIYLILLCAALYGCQAKTKEALSRADGTWRQGLTDEQAAAVQKDDKLCHALIEKLSNDAGDLPERGTVQYQGLIRLKALHDEYTNDVLSGNLKTAAPRLRKQLEGKTLADLAADAMPQSTTP